MAGLFGGRPPKQEKPAEKEDPEVQEAAARAKRRARNRRGLASTVLSRNIAGAGGLKTTLGA